MYKASIRALLRHSIAKLNAGDASMLLKMAAPDVGIVFPGDNSWATMYRPAVSGREQHVTHRGLDECTGFAERFVDKGVQFVIEDILVNGPPWNLRVAMKVHDFIPGPDADHYNNRAVAFLNIRWGKLVRWEDFEDTERTAAWDAAGAHAAEPQAATR